MDGNTTTITVTAMDLTHPVLEATFADRPNINDDIIKEYLNLARIYKVDDGYMLHVILKTVVYKDIGEEFEAALAKINS